MGVVNTTYTFTGTDTITSSKLNNIIDDTKFTSNAIYGSTLQVVSPGRLAVSAGGITSNEIASGAIIPAKLSTGGPSWTNSGDTTLSGDVTVSGNTTISGTTTSIGALTIGTAQMPVPSGTAPIYGVRAWGSFDGSASSPITAGGSGNVASIVRLSTASYRVTFTTNMPNADYAVSFGSSSIVQTNNQAYATISLTARTTASFDFNFVSASGNPTLVTFMVVG